MKKISLYISALLIGATAMQSCSDNWEQPPMDVPTFPAGTEATITIKELKELYWQDNTTYGTTIGKLADGRDAKILGTVVSSCNEGNIYKSLYLQDETGAICIGIDTTAVSSAYPQGMKMAVNTTGLAIGRYNGMMQLGVLQGTGVNRITMPEFRPHAAIEFGGRIDTTLTTIAQLNEVANSKQGQIEWQSKIIRINHVKFQEAGEPFATGSTTSRHIVDDEGNSMIVYNSSYADFANEPMPFGHGDVVGILSCYRTSWQLLLIDTAGLIDFDGEGAPDPNMHKVLNETFADGQGNFTIDNILLGDGLSYVWSADTRYMCMKASAFANNKSNTSDSWLISPMIDLTGYVTPKLTFAHCCNKFDADPATQVSVAVRLDGSNDWNLLTIPTFSSNADWNFVDSGVIDLAPYAGKKFQIGFHYTSSEASSGTWEVKNVLVTAIKQ